MYISFSFSPSLQCTGMYWYYEYYKYAPVIWFAGLRMLCLWYPVPGIPQDGTTLHILLSLVPDNAFAMYQVLLSLCRTSCSHRACTYLYLYCCRMNISTGTIINNNRWAACRQAYTYNHKERQPVTGKKRRTHSQTDLGIYPIWC